MTSDNHVRYPPPYHTTGDADQAHHCEYLPRPFRRQTPFVGQVSDKEGQVNDIRKTKHEVNSSEFPYLFLSDHIPPGREEGEIRTALMFLLAPVHGGTLFS